MEPVKVGEKEYSLEELQGLIQDGQQKREYETKYNTDFPSAWSAYGKTQNENRQIREELDRLKTEPKTDQKTEYQIPNLDEEFQKRGYVKKEDVDKFVDEKLTYREQVQQIASKFQSLEGKLDGSDGQPKFEKDKVLEYMQSHPGLMDPEEAYKSMNFDAITSWKAEQLNKKPGFAQTNTGMTAEVKRPVPVEINRGNLGAALRESLAESSGKV